MSEHNEVQRFLQAVQATSQQVDAVFRTLEERFGGEMKHLYVQEAYLLLDDPIFIGFMAGYIGSSLLLQGVPPELTQTQWYPASAQILGRRFGLTREEMATVIDNTMGPPPNRKEAASKAFLDGVKAAEDNAKWDAGALSFLTDHVQTRLSDPERGTVIYLIPGPPDLGKLSDEVRSVLAQKGPEAVRKTGREVQRKHLEYIIAHEGSDPSLLEALASALALTEVRFQRAQVGWSSRNQEIIPNLVIHLDGVQDPNGYRLAGRLDSNVIRALAAEVGKELRAEGMSIDVSRRRG